MIFKYASQIHGTFKSLTSMYTELSAWGKRVNVWEYVAPPTYMLRIGALHAGNVPHHKQKIKN